MGKLSTSQSPSQLPRFVLALGGQRDVGATGVLAGQRPFGFTMANQKEAQRQTGGRYHSASPSSAAVYSPRRAARLQLARRETARCATATLALSPRQIDRPGS